jgi:RNA polymerase sigma-70 factor (ECF subfamily)
VTDDRTRFEAVFGAHFDAVSRFAAARAEAEVAKDVTAETFLAAWRARDRLPAQPLAWLLAVARRKLADHYRASGRRDALTTRLQTAAPPNAPDHADGVAEHDRVRAAFARLRPGDQELLQLLAWDGLSRAEAVQVLGCSAALFAVRLHRARRRLRTALDDEEPAPTHAVLITKEAR